MASCALSRHGVGRCVLPHLPTLRPRQLLDTNGATEGGRWAMGTSLSLELGWLRHGLCRALAGHFLVVAFHVQRRLSRDESSKVDAQPTAIARQRQRLRRVCAFGIVRWLFAGWEVSTLTPSVIVRLIFQTRDHVRLPSTCAGTPHLTLLSAFAPQTQAFHLTLLH